MLGRGKKIAMKEIFRIFTVLSAFSFIITGCGKPAADNTLHNETELESETVLEAEPESETEIKAEIETNTESESEEEAIKHTNPVYQEYSYGIGHSQLDYMASVTGLDFEKPEEIEAIPVIEVCIPANPEREKRINKAIAEQCIQILPMNKEWLNKVEMQVVYRSERYLCYEYVHRRPLPEEYDNVLLPLYVTVDLKSS